VIATVYFAVTFGRVTFIPINRHFFNILFLTTFDDYSSIIFSSPFQLPLLCVLMWCFCTLVCMVNTPRVIVRVPSALLFSSSCSMTWAPLIQCTSLHWTPTRTSTICPSTSRSAAPNWTRESTISMNITPMPSTGINTHYGRFNRWR